MSRAFRPLIAVMAVAATLAGWALPGQAGPAVYAAAEEQSGEDDSPGGRIRVAKRIAARVMDDPCRGEVRTIRAKLPPDVNARSLWAGDESPFRDCVIVFPSDRHHAWAKFCSVMIHEYGHLAGRAHSPDPGSVMYPHYVRRNPHCPRRSPRAASGDTR